MGFFAEAGSAFILGLLTPLGAACVLPLYPGFLSYISHQFTGDENPIIYALTGLLAALGVLIFMAAIGLVFTFLLQQSLTGIIQVASPIAFFILGIISILLLLDIDLAGMLPTANTPTSDNPLVNALLFGLFFGAIVIPCNPGFIAVLFTQAATVTDTLVNMVSFLAFGLGMGTPLIVFSLASAQWSKQVISFTTTHKTTINRTAGAIMLIISLYYLTCIFSILPFADHPVCTTLSNLFTALA